jgi:hypothetical protein
VARLIKIAACKQNGRHIAPLSKLNAISLINLLNKEPLKVLFARPCTILEDCTSTFPAIAAISGVKKNKFPCSSIALQ